MTHKTVYLNFTCCGDNEFQATYLQGKMQYFCCMGCGSGVRFANDTEGEARRLSHQVGHNTEGEK